MTIQDDSAGVSSAPAGAAERLAAYQPIRPPKSLAHEVVERIRAEIAGGKLPPGARLPTEQTMIAAFGVSRTVVREAVAALRAEGLVSTRQGVGAFVADQRARQPFRLAPGGLPSIEEVLQVMELRTGVETEAAGLAAARATKAQVHAVRAALQALDAAIAAGGLATEEDFAFHRSIAAATGNPHFPRFLEFLGHYIIPRLSVRVAAPRPRLYLDRIQAEHRDILAAIEARDPGEAQTAMRRHLARSRDRYSRLAGAAGAEKPTTTPAANA
jgi:DNA-binding FadR family transcriptional regulator